MSSSSTQKSAGAITYLVEELSDARIRCDQLVRYLNEAVKLIEKSPKKDHFFEEAGHLIEAIPATAFRLEKALQAVALAASKLDYEELKQELRPEKVQQLEKVLEEVRIRPVHRRSEPVMNIQQATKSLQKLAQQTRESGLPVRELLGLITDLETDSETGGTKTANETDDPAVVLDRLSSALSSATPEQKLSRVRLAGLLRRLVADSMVESLLSEESVLKMAAEEVSPPDVLVEEMLSTMKMVARSAGVGRWRVALLHLTSIVEGIGSLLTQMGNEGASVKTQALFREVLQTARMAQRMRPEDMLPVMAGDKTAADPMRAMERMLDSTKDQLKEMEHSFGLLKRDPGKNAPQKDNFASAVGSLMSVGRMVQRALGKTASQEEEEEKQSRFEEGKPADPTKLMDKDDAEKWKANTDKYEDKFKKEAAADLNKYQVERYQFYVDASIFSLKSARKTPKNPKRHLETALRSMGSALAQLEPERGGPASEAVFKAADKMNRLRPVTDFVKEASEEETKESRFEEGKPADPTKLMTPEDAEKWKSNTDKYEDKFKTASLASELREMKDILRRYGYNPDDAEKLQEEGMGPEELEGRAKVRSGVGSLEHSHGLKKKASNSWKLTASEEEEEKQSRFEEGKPADPTENMTPEDAEKWKSNTDKYEDKFKEASSGGLDAIVSRITDFLKSEGLTRSKYWTEKGIPHTIIFEGEGFDQGKVRSYLRSTLRWLPGWTYQVKPRTVGLKYIPPKGFDPKDPSNPWKVAAAPKWDKSKVKRWMQQQVDDHVDRKTDEVNATSLAEEAALQFDIYEDDRGYKIPEEIFELSADVAEAWEKKNKKSASLDWKARSAAKHEIKVPNNDTVKAVGKVIYNNGKVEYWYQLLNGAKMSYTSLEKFRYQLRNQGQVPQANKLIDELEKELPTPKGKKAANPWKVAAEFNPGDKVVVKDSHGSPKFRGDTGEVEKSVQFGKYYVDLKKNGRSLVDGNDLEKA